ncbi:DUF721 domain-containing protein [Lacibacter sp. H375]|uniref:DUF721 domain-containing protein n=1 Tax=Lacibacter sp. H375 TaxID=3133424 RepID=UPI0030BB5B7B
MRNLQIITSDLPFYYFLLPIEYCLLRIANSINYLRNMAEMSIQEAMEQFLKQSKLKQRVRALEIKDVWAELMGNTIAKYTDDIKLINQQLIITTTVAPLKQELLYQKEKIRNRINELFNEHAVKEVIIK